MTAAPGMSGASQDATPLGTAVGESGRPERAGRSICVDGWRCAPCQGQQSAGTHQRPSMCGMRGSKDWI